MGDGGRGEGQFGGNSFSVSKRLELCMNLNVAFKKEKEKKLSTSRRLSWPDSLTI